MNIDLNLIQNPFDFDKAMTCVSKVGKETEKNQAVDCVIHSLAATDFLPIKEATKLASQINFTKRNKGIAIDNMITFLGDELHKKIDIVTLTRREYTDIKEFLDVVNENYLYQNLRYNNATPISFDRLILRVDINGNTIREPAIGHNIVVINNNNNGIIDIPPGFIIMDTQQNIITDFNTYFIKYEPHVYHIYLYTESKLSDDAMHVVANPSNLARGGKHKRNKKRKSTIKRKSNIKKKSKRRKNLIKNKF